MAWQPLFRTSSPMSMAAPRPARRWNIRSLAALVVITLFTALILLGASKGMTARYPVTGSIVFDGRPVTGAVATFHERQSLAPVARGTTDATGRFRVISRGIWPGIEPGDYFVTISIQKPEIRGEDYVFGANLASKQFSDVRQTPLRVQVTSGAIDLGRLEFASQPSLSIERSSGQWLMSDQ